MPILKLLKSLFTFHMMYVVDPDASAVVVPPVPKPNPILDIPDDLVPEAWKDHVRDLRRENKKNREEKDQRDTEFSQKIKSETDRLNSEYATKLSGFNDRIIRAELKAAAIAAGMIDLDGLKLADLTKVTLKEDGTVDGAEAMLTELKAQKAYLFGVPNTSSTTTTPPANKPPEAKKATEMTAEEYAVARKAIK